MPPEVIAEAKSAPNEVVTWRDGELWFGVNIAELDEIVDCSSYLPLGERGPSICEGFSGTRGQIVHVLSRNYFRRCLGLDPGLASCGMRPGISKLIVFRAGGVRWGVLTDTVGSVERVGSSTTVHPVAPEAMSCQLSGRCVTLVSLRAMVEDRG